MVTYIFLVKDNLKKSMNKTEKSLKKIIDVICLSLDLNDILSAICKELLDIFKVDRVDIASFPTLGNYSDWKINVEYVSDSNFTGMKDIDFPLVYLGTYLLDKGMDIILDDIAKSNYPDYFKDTYINKLGVKSILAIPIKKGANKWGMLGLLQYRSCRKWTGSEIDLLHLTSDLIYNAIKQTELYSEVKEQTKIAQRELKRETLLADLIGTVRKSQNVPDVLNAICYEATKAFNAQLSGISLLSSDPEEQLSIKLSKNIPINEIVSSIRLGKCFDEEHEKLVSKYPQDINYVYYWLREIMIPGKKLIIDNILESDIPDHLKKLYTNWKIKSMVTVPIKKDNDNIGILYVGIKDYYKHWTEEDLSLLETIADQSYLLIKQAQLFESVRKIVEREAILRKIIVTVRNTLDLDVILSTVSKEIIDLFKVQRVSIGEFNPRLESRGLYLYKEYGVNKDTKIFSNDPDFEIIKSYWTNVLLKNREIETISIENIPESNTPDDFKQAYARLGVKSILSIPIKSEDILWNRIFLSEYDYYRKWTKDEISFLETISTQVGTAIRQSELYSTTKKQAKREALHRKVVETIRSTLDLNEMIAIICNEVGELFKVQRVALGEYRNKLDYSDWIVRHEYKSRLDIKGVTIPDYDAKNKIYIGKTLLDEGKIMVFDNILESDTPDYFKKTYTKLGVKSILGVPIKRDADKWGVLFISEYDHYRHWTEEEINLLQTIADQVYIAIKQAELYISTKNQAEREKLLREMIELTRNTLVFNQIKNTVVNQLGKFFNADRCLIRDYDENKGIFLSPTPESEYLSSPEIKSLVNMELDSDVQLFFGNKQLTSYDAIVINDVNQFITTNNLKNTSIEKFLKESSLKSGILKILFTHNYEILGTLAIHFIKEKTELSHSDIDFIKILANQASIALYQSKLYESVKQTAEKEKLLREIISELKLFQTFDLAYEYILEKLSEIFDADRAIFIEIPEFKFEKLVIKYEYICNKNLPFVKNKQLPESCQQMFREILNDLKTLVVNNIDEFHSDNEEAQKFFKDNNIKSFITSPFVKFNKEIKKFGILSLCSSGIKSWSSKETELLKSITESVVTVLWEILKLNEINELRDTFILTLAHDLQVPLVGEKKALEFLESRLPEQPIGKFREFIKETIQSNQNLFNLLTRLLDSYYYESGKKSLNLIECNMESVINQVLAKLIQFVKSKSMKIVVNIEKNLPYTKIDRAEIEKALYNLIENAIMYTQTGGEVIISCYKQDNYITTCVNDNGPGIVPEIGEKIFKRYEMAATIERKIGAGLSLYLAKQIIEAHKGRIWYETEIKKSTTFCFILPLNKKQSP